MTGLLPHQSHSPTSKDAARQADGRAPTQRQRVLVCLRLYPGGLTDEEIQEHLQLNPSTQRPRRIELYDAGLVRDSGRKRRTSSGRRAVVWVAVAPGEQMALDMGGEVG